MASIARQWGYVGDVNRTVRNIEFLTNDEVKSAADEILISTTQCVATKNPN